MRCQREENLPWVGRLSVEREYRIMRVLQDNGVKVPRVYGFCPEPEGILMASIPGRDRFDGDDPAELRDRVLMDYVEELIRAHAIAPETFETAGLHRPRSAREIGLMGFELSEKWYRAVKTAPDPVNEYIVDWIRRNVPDERDRLVWTHFDAGQFLHHDGRMTALMDVEFACLGDPLADLGAMRMRDTAQPIGDLTRAYRHYAQITGEVVDRHVVNFHAVRFALLTSLLSVGARLDPVPEFDLAQWESWSLLSQQLCLEIIAEEMGVTLEADEDLPVPAPSRRRPWILSSQRVLTDILADLPEQDHLSYRLRIARDLTSAALRADEIALELEERERSEEQQLLGHRPSSWEEAERLLEAAILEADGDQDGRMLRFLHRRLLRQQMVLDPAMRDVRGFTVQTIDWDQVS
ncbi:phosphotransferase [Nocardia africana]